MGRAPSHKKQRFAPKKKEPAVVCGRQFPECPAEPNDNDCKTCPLYKK